MNPQPYIAIFAGLSITALTLQIIEDLWVPMLLGVVVTLTIVWLSRKAL